MTKRTRILLVDDDPSVLEVFSAILGTQDYEVWNASTGQEGLQLARDRVPDLVLSDVMLPDLNGFELCRQIKADPALADVFVVLVSGAAVSTAQKVDGFTTGADEYLVKPIVAAEFLARIRTILRLQNTTAALRASEQRHRRLVEILPEAVGLVDREGRFLSVNGQGATMLGYANSEELLGKSIFDLTLAGDHERLRADIATVLEAGVLRNVDYLLLRKNGEFVPAEVSAALAVVGNSHSPEIVLAVRDTTQHKEAEKMLRDQARFLASNARFLQTLMNAIPAPVFYSDRSGKYLGCNRVFEEYLGVSQEQIIGQAAGEVAPADSNAGPGQTDRVLLERPGVRTREGSLLHADGTHRQVMINKATFQNSEGEVAGLVGVILDITERKRAEEKIQLLADAIQSTHELICITDRENHFTFVNKAFLSTYGYTLEELLGRTVDVLYSAKNRPALCNHVLEQTLLGGWKGELLNRRKDGTEFPISLTTSQIKNAKGDILGLVGVARDISERIRAERRNLALSQLGYRLSASSSPEHAAGIILDIASELFGWDAGFVHLYSPQEEKPIRLLTIDTVNNERVPFPPRITGVTPLMRLIMEQGPRLVNRRDQHSLPVKTSPFGNVERPAACMMYVPIHARGAVTGLLSIQSYTPHVYSQDDLQLLQTLADHCGDALERMKVDEALRKTEGKYRSIVENASEGIFQTNPAGHICSANPALTRMLGYGTPDELMAAELNLVRDLCAKPEKSRELKKLLKTQGSVRSCEFEHLRKDGSIIWMSMNTHAVRDTAGAVQYYEGTLQDVTKRKAAEEALQMSQVLQKALLDNMSDPAWLQDAAGRFLACNEPFARFLRHPRQQIVGRTLFELGLPEATVWSREDKQVIQSGKPGRFEWRRLDANNHIGWFDAIKSPLMGDGGKATGTVGIARDITERKWLENLLRLQRDFATFLNSTDDLAVAAERLLKVVLENEGLDCGAVYLVNPETDTLELAAHQGLSTDFAKHISQFEGAPQRNPSLTAIGSVPPSDPAATLTGIMQRLKSEGLLTLEAVPIEDCGRVVALLNIGSHGYREIPIKTRRAIEAFAAQAGGAIARIHAEQSLRTSQQVLEKTIHSISAAVFIVDASATTIQDCNPAANRMFGYTRSEMIGQSTALLHLSDAMREKLTEHRRSSAQGKVIPSPLEIRMKRKDGTSFPTDQSGGPIRNEANQIVSWVYVIHDITERKRVEEDLRQLSRRIIEAQEAERQRVARELHDGVNQLIASAKMRLRKVQDSAMLKPAARELLARCDEVLFQALDENRRIAHDLRPADLDALGLTEACRNCCKQLQSRGRLKVKFRLARFNERFPPALELNLFRIVQEALNNAEKHADATTVKLLVVREQQCVVVRIQDDGRGFDPVAYKAPKRRRIGTGLSNMRERAAILGGACEVTSGPNQGTTITVRVPCEPLK